MIPGPSPMIILTDVAVMRTLGGAHHRRCSQDYTTTRWWNLGFRTVRRVREKCPTMVLNPLRNAGTHVPRSH